VPKKVRAVDTRTFNGPVLGDKYTFLNFEVISAAKPTHTIAAKKAGATGLVQVEVLISENGDVVSAKARTGNKLLWDEAERAALASKFNRPSVNGQPARAMGFLVYRFGPATDEDDDDY
jgi:protein TonB